MISAEEARQMSITLGVPLANVEKDYVIGWLLWGIANTPYLRSNLVLKGGNCLRKIYFPDTRFSDDLDFTAAACPSSAQFQTHLEEVCRTVEQTSGIPFSADRLCVEQKATPHPECTALDGRVYFRGFAGDSSLTMRIKFDISDYERLVLPPQYHPIIHPFSDSDLCRANVQTYSLEEVLAEKLRSWIQRTRSRDLFDVVKIVQSNAIPISKANVASAFFQKTIFKDIPMAGRDEMLHSSKFQAVSDAWERTIVCPVTAVILAANAISLFASFVTALFEPGVLSALGINPLAPIRRYMYNIDSGIREAIIQAGKVRQLIRMRYDGIDRTIEPYSFRFKMTKEGYGAEYFYGFDRSRGNTIKSFFLHQVQGVSILPDNYMPRWVVEF